MKCQKCGKREANVKYTQIINGVKKEMNLCEDCAKELGIGKELNFNMSMNLPSFLGGFFDEYNMDSFIPSIGSIREEGCKNCGTTYNEFVNTGLFGCMDCYNIFSDKLDPILNSIQGSNRHVGRKVKLDSSIVKNMEKKKEEMQNSKNDKVTLEDNLEEKLKLAIKEERYEDAAKIRDEIKKNKKENN